MKKLYLILVIAVFLIAFILRFYRLSDLPKGLNEDETAIGYNAYLILQTGRDEYGNFMPLYFKSFGDYKLPVYIYLTGFSEKVFGVNAFAVRFWSAFLGSLSVVVFYFLVRHFSRNKIMELVFGLLLAINPWHLFFSRAAFEVNVANFFILSGVLSFVLGTERKKALLITLSIIAFGLSVYTYNVTRLIAPVLLCFLIFIYREKINSI